MYHIVYNTLYVNIVYSPMYTVRNIVYSLQLSVCELWCAYLLSQGSRVTYPTGGSLGTLRWGGGARGGRKRGVTSSTHHR